MLTFSRKRIFLSEKVRSDVVYTKLPRNCSVDGCGNVVSPNQVVLFVHNSGVTSGEGYRGL